MSDQKSRGRPQSLVPAAVSRRFAWKMLLAVVVVMAVTGLVGGAFVVRAGETLEGQVDEQVRSTAALQATELEQWVTRHRQSALSHSQSAAVNSPRMGMTRAYFEGRGEELRSDVVAVHYVSLENATVLASTNDSAVGTSMNRSGVTWADEDLSTVRSEVEDPSVVHFADDPYRSPVDGTRVVGFLSTSPERIDRAVVVEAALAARLDSIQQTSERAYTSLHDGDEVVSADERRASEVPREFVAADGSGVTTLRGQSGGADAVRNELLGRATVEGTDWTVVTHVPTSAAFAIRNQIRTGILVVVLVPLVLLSALGVVFGGRTDAALTRLTGKAEAIEAGDLDVSLERRRADQIGRLTAAFDSMRDGLREEIRAARSARKEAEVAREEAVQLNESLEAAADEYSAVMRECARGDLTLRMEADGRHEAMDRIATDFNEMIEELEQTTGQLETFAGEVAETGEDVEERARQARDAAEQIAGSVEAIADDADDQRARLERVGEEGDALAATLEECERRHGDVDLGEAHSRAETVSEAVATARTVSDETATRAETVADSAAEQATELAAVTEQAASLQRYARPLGDVLGRFETEREHEFFFPSGPGRETGGSEETPTVDD